MRQCQTALKSGETQTKRALSRIISQFINIYNSLACPSSDVSAVERRPSLIKSPWIIQWWQTNHTGRDPQRSRLSCLVDGTAARPQVNNSVSSWKEFKGHIYVLLSCQTRIACCLAWLVHLIQECLQTVVITQSKEKSHPIAQSHWTWTSSERGRGVGWCGWERGEREKKEGRRKDCKFQRKLLVKE